MNKTTIHGAACAKARSLMGKLLKDDDYRKLMQSRDIHEFVDYLIKNTVYKEVLLDSSTIVHRNEVELSMRRYVLKNSEKFYHYYFDNYRKLFKILFMRYEVENIKLLIRAITRQEDIKLLADHSITSEIFSYIDYENVIKARSISEFIESLKGTIYYKILKVYLNEDSVKMQFYMEMSLDRIYFRKLKDIITVLKGKDNILMTELLGKNADLLNIQWIYRAKKFYSISSEEILNYALEGGIKYDYKKLKEFCYFDDIDKIKEVVNGTEYEILFKSEDILMERDMERYLYYLLDDLLKKGNNTIIVPITFLHKLEYEVRDLFTILECIKYDITDTQEYLVRLLN